MTTTKYENNDDIMVKMKKIVEGEKSTGYLRNRTVNFVL